MKKVISLILFLTCTMTLFAQTVVKDDLGSNNPNLQAVRGTYDIIIDATKGDHIVEMTPDILAKIEENREEHNYAYIDIAPSIMVRIHPKNNHSGNPRNTLRDKK